MELLIRQRVFSWTDTYDVYDGAGTPRYFVKAEFLTLGHQIHVYRKDSGREIGSVHQRWPTLMPVFDIVLDGRNAGTVRREFTLFSPRYTVEYRGWEVQGDFLGWDYAVTQGDRQVLTISKKWLSWGDTYSLQFSDPANEAPGLLLVLAIDAANCSGSD